MRCLAGLFRNVDRGKILLWDQPESTCPVFEKIFRFHPDANHFSDSRRSVPIQGRIAIVTDAGWNAVDAGCAFDERRWARGRRSRVVLTPRRRRQALRRYPRGDGDKKADRRGEHEAAVKTIACGNAGCSGATVVTTLVCFLPLHTGLRVQRAPGIPRALIFHGAKRPRIIRADRAAGS